MNDHGLVQFLRQPELSAEPRFLKRGRRIAFLVMIIQPYFTDGPHQRIVFHRIDKVFPFLLVGREHVLGMQAADKADVRGLRQRGRGVENHTAVRRVALVLKKHVNNERHAGRGGAFQHAGKIGQQSLVVEMRVTVRAGEGQAEALRQRPVLG